MAACLALLVLAAPASAHADLKSAEPAPNSRVDTAPTELRISFTERLSNQYTRVQVVDGNDTDYANETRIHDDDRTRVTVPLQEMPDGVYSVRWRTLSNDDGHTRSGVYFLAVNVTLSRGDGGTGPDAAGGAAGYEDPPPLESALRGLAFLGATLAAGIPLFLLLVRGIELPVPVHRRLGTMTAGGAALATVAVVGLTIQFAGRIETSVTQAFDTEPGRLLAVRAALLAAATFAFLSIRLRSGNRAGPLLFIGLGLAMAALAATSLGGHAAADADARLWAIPNDWAHQVSVAFWVAGVVALVAAAADASTTELAGSRLIRRFSPWAVSAVLVIVATGTLASVQRLESWPQLWQTYYGRALLAKILLVVPLVALGAYHRYRLLPALETAGERAHDFGRLKVSAGIEVAIMVIILAAAGLLTSLSPPAAEVTGGDAAAGGPPFYAFDEGDLNLRVYITPLPVTVGFQEIYLNVTRDDGSKLERDQHKAFLFLHPPSGDGGEASPREAHFFANRTFHWAGALFTEPGNWTVELVVQGGQGDEYVYIQHEFTVRVRSG